MTSKEKILEETTKLIHAKGFNNTSIQDILDASSVSKSNFYYHFKTKEELGFEVLALRIQQFYDFAVRPALENDLKPPERIDAFLDRLLAIGLSPQGELGCPFGNLAQEMSAVHEPLRKALSDFFHAGAELVEQCFEEGKRQGDFKESLPSKQLSEFVLAQMQGAFLLRKTHKDPKVIERNVSLLRDVIKGWRT
ncbi:MAG: TetR/AcrR family transcriptional regulator [Candidatus Abyssobacteria bacterium SURF_5]|uniref:TetR/AcrR family transcriptional regulator n=1 Tax=Abyssobacteria bacterium (strain SURF_5) TaxID=2093360 RepID=A0A3A4NKM0_ABYX5|nr:MAG: TetR/AcrR family transcriptional regulator [Candidatus Abyssubacteria bacterium SURF_5]